VLLSLCGQLMQLSFDALSKSELVEAGVFAESALKELLTSQANMSTPVSVCLSYWVFVRLVLSSRLAVLASEHGRAVMLSTLACTVPLLKPPHFCFSLRWFVDVAMAARNYGYAAEVLQELVKHQPPDATHLTTLLSECQQAGKKNAVPLPAHVDVAKLVKSPPTVPARFSYETLEVVPKAQQCSYCSFISEPRPSASPCSLCKRRGLVDLP